MFSDRDSGIMIAADVVSLMELHRLTVLASAVPEVVAIKVGFTLALRHGLPAVVNTIREVTQIPIIYDHQKAATDIPQMGEPFASVCRSAGVQAAILFPQSGPRVLEGFVKALVNQNLVPIVGLVMTHQAYLQSEGGYLIDEAPNLMCQAALSLGVTDFVLPGTKTDVIRHFATGTLGNRKEITIMMPGIGSQGGSISSAFKAAEPHRRIAIVGSAVYAAADPRSALLELAREVAA